jgi:hypothetical protein
LTKTNKNNSEKGFLERFGVTTFKEGFIIGMLASTVLQLGIVTIVTPLQQNLVLFLVSARNWRGFFASLSKKKFV